MFHLVKQQVLHAAVPDDKVLQEGTPDVKELFMMLLGHQPLVKLNVEKLVVASEPVFENLFGNRF